MRAPSGRGVMVPAGGVAPTKAAAEFAVLHMLSSVCKPGLEEVAAAAPGYPKIFQLYIRGDAAWVDERVAAAVAQGYAGLCITVDLDNYGRRERDIAKRYKPTARRASGATGAGDPFQQAFTWKDIARIRKNCPVPMFIKGIATAEDARIAIDHGVEVVLAAGLEQQRDVRDGGGVRGAFAFLPLANRLVDARVDESLEDAPCRGIGEHDVAEDGAIDGAIRRKDRSAEVRDDRVVRRPAGLDRGVRDLISIDGRRAERLETLQAV